MDPFKNCLETVKIGHNLAMVPNVNITYIYNSIIPWFNTTPGNFLQNALATYSSTDAAPTTTILREDKSNWSTIGWLSKKRRIGGTIGNFSIWTNNKQKIVLTPRECR